MIPQLQSALTEAQLTQIRNEVINILEANGILETSVSTEGNETWYKNHPRGSFMMMDRDGNVAFYGHNSELAPNLGNLSLGSTGNMKISSGHALIIEAQDCLQTGGALEKGGSNSAKSITIRANGDIHIESNGPGGIYIKSPKTLRLEGEDVEIVATQKLSLKAGSLTPTVGTTGISAVGSGEISITGATVKTSANTIIDNSLSQHKIVNNGHIEIEQLPNPSAPGLPTGNLFNITTTGSIEYVAGGDFAMRVTGKVRQEIAGTVLPTSLLNGGNPTYGIQPQAFLTNIALGDHLENLLLGNHVVNVTVGSAGTNVVTAAAGGTGIWKTVETGNIVAAAPVGVDAKLSLTSTETTVNKNTTYSEANFLGALTTIA